MNISMSDEQSPLPLPPVDRSVVVAVAGLPPTLIVHPLLPKLIFKGA